MVKEEALDSALVEHNLLEPGEADWDIWYAI
jgi:hypothetical protein